jgi:hypothetical protein
MKSVNLRAKAQSTSMFNPTANNMKSKSEHWTPEFNN